MVSTKGDKKESKKKLPSSAKADRLSKKGSGKKKLSRRPSQQSVDHSERTSAETSANDEEELSVGGTPSMLSLAPSDAGAGAQEIPGVQKPPLLHFIPVEVKLDPDFSHPAPFFENVKVNKNMVLTNVKQGWVPYFMIGDQVASINGVHLWNRRQFDQELSRLKKMESPDNPIVITVIRVWNYSCPTKEMIEKIGGCPDEKLQYFVARIWHYKHMNGMIMNSVKKFVYVSEMRWKTDAGYGLLPGDMLLLIGDKLTLKQKNAKSFKKKKSEYREYIRAQSMQKYKYIDIFACRLATGRSSPNPSLETELAEMYPERVKILQEKIPVSPPTPPTSGGTGGGAGGGAGTAPNPAPALPTPKAEKKEAEDPMALLEADALEIALRELCLLQQSVRVDCPLPYTDKGKSLLRAQSTISSVRASPSIETSVYLPMSPSAAMTSMKGTPSTKSQAKPKMLKKWIKPQGRQNVISFKPETETTKITSDIAEEAELKKCDPRSGIVAYIKNAFNN